MNPRWRAFLDSPGADHKRLLAVVAIALLAIFGVVMLLLDDGVPEPPAQRVAPASPRPTVTPLAATHEDVVLPPALRSAKRAARRFLGGYLDYSYGHINARQIPLTSDELKAQLGTVRVPPSVRRRHPRVTGLTTAHGATPRRAAFTAIVREGRRDPYSVRAVLQRTPVGWRAVDVG